MDAPVDAPVNPSRLGFAAQSRRSSRPPSRAILDWLPTVLSLGRAALAPAFWFALTDARSDGSSPNPAVPALSKLLPLLIATLASGTDFVDGKLARRLGCTSSTGAVLDIVADAAFVLVSFSALARAGLISWVLPLATTLSLSGLALAWPARTSDVSTQQRVGADRLGHAAGVMNFGLVILASSEPLGWSSAGWLYPASLGVAMINLAPVALRRRRGLGRLPGLS